MDNGARERNKLRLSAYRLGIALLMVGGIAGWLVLLLTGTCRRPICRLVGVYAHEVRTLADYAQYLVGTDLYLRHDASVLSFDCDALRDQLITYLHEAMAADAPFGMGANPTIRKELERLDMLGAQRDGRVLRLMTVSIGGEDLDAWANKLRSSLERDPEDKTGHTLILAIRRLFDAVVLHAGDREVMVAVPGSVKCDRP